MWSKGDQTICRADITEITKDGIIITVATTDADTITDTLNEYECLKQTLDFEYQLCKKAINDKDLDSETKQHYYSLIEFLQLLRTKHERLINKTKWGVI